MAQFHVFLMTQPASLYHSGVRVSTRIVKRRISYVELATGSHGIAVPECKRSRFKLFASDNTSGASVERNDAAATGPLMKPDPMLTAEDAVKVQMDALALNDEPRPDHGLEVVYYFANLEGTLDGGSLSQYFGFASDLYHFGHFALKFKTRYPELIGHDGYHVISNEENIKDDEEHPLGASTPVSHIHIKVKDESSSGRWVFHLSKSARGKLPPCWLTDSLLKDDQDG